MIINYQANDNDNTLLEFDLKGFILLSRIHLDQKPMSLVFENYKGKLLKLNYDDLYTLEHDLYQIKICVKMVLSEVINDD